MRGGWVLALLLAPALAACLAPAPDSPADDRSPGLPVPAGTYDAAGPFSRVLDVGRFAILADEVTTLESAVDGAAIQIAVARPDVPPGTRVPVIAWLTPYLSDLATTPIAGQDGSGGLLVPGEDGLEPATGVHGAFLVDNFVPHGYAVAAVAARGSAGSGGCIEFFSRAETADLLQALDWLAAQEWSSGAIGTYGLSYEAGTQWAVAAAAHPAVRTIVPASGPNDLWTATVRNGSVSRGWIAQPLVQGPATTYRAPDQNAGVACDQPLMTAELAAFGARPTRDGPWAAAFEERSFREGIERQYRGSVLLIHGFRDGSLYPRNALPWAGTLADRGLVVKQLLGPWGHVLVDSPDAATPRWDFAEKLLAWYDRWLKGDSSADLGPAVEVADSAGAWRAEAAWPPADTRELVLHLTADGALATEPGSAPGSAVAAFDPFTALVDLRGDAPASLPCPGCAAFATEPLASDLRFAGLPRVHLTVTPAGPGGHLTARLFAMAEGDATLLAAGQMDLRYVDGEEPREVVPGTPVLAPMELEPTDAVVPAGARLLLVVSQGGYGGTLYHGTSMPTYPARIETGDGRSVVRLATFERSGDAFFVVP